MPELPRGTVTLLFTDIEGSTRLWEERPDEMRAALAQHDEILRSAIEGNHGYVFATGGDGFAAAFARAKLRRKFRRRSDRGLFFTLVRSIQPGTNGQFGSALAPAGRSTSTTRHSPTHEHHRGCQ